MDFNDTAEEATFREQARAWLADNVPSESELGGLNYVERSKLWQKRKYDAGMACIRWPKDLGGRGASAMEEIIFEQEESKFALPQGFLGIGLKTCAGAILGHASEEQKRRYLPKLASGEEVWCQLFSEPGAGSDLAGLRTRAVRDGDDWVVNGQKVWNSGAHFADWGILVTRSDADLPKHKGLTFFVVDMKTPGIDARPIKQVPGTSEFNEVFYRRLVFQCADADFLENE